MAAVEAFVGMMVLPGLAALAGATTGKVARAVCEIPERPKAPPKGPAEPKKGPRGTNLDILA